MIILQERDQWLIIVALSLLFTIIAIIFYYRRDIYEPEPKLRIIFAFLLGILSVIPAFFIEEFLINIYPLIGFLNGVSEANSLINAPLVEELCKGIFVIFLSKQRSFDGPIDGIVYGAVVGSGFAFAENIVYGLFSTITVNFFAGITLTVFRGAFEIISHPLYTALFGYGVSLNLIGKSKTKFNKYWVSILLHFSWNFMALNYQLGLIVVIVLSILILRKIIKNALAIDKFAFENGYYSQNKPYIEWIKQIQS